MKLAAFVMASALATPSLAPSTPLGQPIPPEFRPYVASAQASCSYRELPSSCREGASTQLHPVVTQAQALSDIRLLHYLFNNAYSGHDYWAGHGVDFPGMYAALEHQAQASSSVRVVSLEDILARFLRPIQDGHLGIVGKRDHGFFVHQNAYFADVVVEKKGDRYVTVASTCDGVATGSVFTGKKGDLFPTLAARGRSDFLVGSLSARFEHLLVTSFDGHDVAIPLHPIRMPEWQNYGIGPFSLDHVDGIPVVRASDFSIGDDAALERFENSALSLRMAKAVILDLRDNGGGSSDYPERFFERLGGVADWRSAGAVLRSPPIDQSWAMMDASSSPQFLQAAIRSARQDLAADRQNPQRLWHFDAMGDRQATGAWPGKLVVLMDRHIASSGEAAIAYSRSVKDDVLVGENSMGMGTFGEVRRYVLPHTGLQLFLPSKIFLNAGFEEGRGYLPDFWLDSARPIQEIVRWLHHPDSYRFVPKVPADLSRIDVERVVNGVPQGLTRSPGANDDLARPLSRIAEDPHGGVDGGPCLRISADAKTGRFSFLGVDIPPDVSWIQARWLARGKNVRRDGHGSAQCVVGLFYTDAKGHRRFDKIARFHGTFGWTPGVESLHINRKGASAVEFGIAFFESGDLWIDHLKFRWRKQR